MRTLKKKILLKKGKIYQENAAKCWMKLHQLSIKHPDQWLNLGSQASDERICKTYIVWSQKSGHLQDYRNNISFTWGKYNSYFLIQQ